MLCAESSRLAVRDYQSINARANERGHAPVAGQRKALKRTVYVEESAPPSDSARTQWRYVSAKQRRADAPIETAKVLDARLVPLQKISTNLFLSVLNL